jgi:hypothetical protein
LPPRAARVVVVCAFCGASVIDGVNMVLAADYRRALADLPKSDDGSLPCVIIGGLPYRVFGRVARGESTDVFLAERAHPVTERVLVKVLRAAADADLMDREWEVLAALHRSETEGAREGLRRLPTPVARARVVVAGEPDRRSTVFRARSGFADTFEDVMRAYPAGVDGRHASWMWRRILEGLSWVHRSGFAHGALLPQHLVVHARDHGVLLVGWSCAARLGERAPLPVMSPAWRDLYAPELLAGAPPSAATDVVMSARCVARVLGGTAERVPKAVPPPLAALVEAAAAGRAGDDAWAVSESVAGAAREAYGRPAYHRFEMPRSP